MIRVVLDTNVVVSGLFWRGESYRIIRLLNAGNLKLVISPRIIAEYLRVVQSDEILEKIGETQRLAVTTSAHKLLLDADVVEPKIRLDVVKADPDDDKFLEAALAGKAKYLISKDKRLLKIGAYEDVRIITPEAFLELL